MSGTAHLSERRRQRILKARKTGRARDFELMLALRPQRPAVIAEGDSWFAYPPPNLLLGDRSNIVNWLSRSASFNLLQLSANGDEAAQMTSGPAKHRLLRLLQRFEVDFLLFSGGGNDLVGDYDFPLLLREGSAIDSDDFRDYLRLSRVRRRLDLVEIAYRDLVDYCQEFSLNPRLRIVTHCYDYAMPSPRGARFAGGLIRPGKGRSWMYPALRARQIPRRHHAAIARFLIDGLAERLQRLADEHPGRFILVDTRGLLQPAHWINEIHPGREGFGLVAGAILAELKRLDPRV